MPVERRDDSVDYGTVPVELPASGLLVFDGY